jgi:hypothetical protein
MKGKSVTKARLYVNHAQKVDIIDQASRCIFHIKSQLINETKKICF